MKKLLMGLFVFGFLFVGSHVHAAAPDLIVTDFSWSPEVPHMSNNPVDHLDLNVTIKNIGDASITLPENMYVTLYKGSIGVGGFALGTQVYILNPGDSQAFDFRNAQSPNVLEQAGTFDLTVKVDGNSPTYSINSIENGLVSESNENNNTLTKKITIVGDSNSVTPSITVLTPNGRDMYEVGQQINVTWDSTGIPASSNNIDITLHGYNANGVIVWSKELSSFTLNDGQEKVILPTYLGGVPLGKNFVISVGTDSTNNPSPIFDYSDTTFTIGKATDVTNGGCSNGEVYSSTSGQACPTSGTPSITVFSPNGGESYKAGQQITVKWESQNLPLGAKIRVILDSAWDLIPSYNPSTYYVSNTGSTTFTLPTESDFIKGNPSPWGKNFSFVVSTPMPNSTGALALDLTDNTFTITSSTDTSCLAGEIYSSVTGKKCFEKDEVKDTGCIAGYNYSSMTGKPCALGLYKNDNTDVLNPITSSIKRTLKIGIKGDDVKALQVFLNLLADGSFGPKTQAKVMEWQAAHGLTADGAFGRMSREKAGLIQ